MSFWTWAKVKFYPSLSREDDVEPFSLVQGLEDRFDHQSRKRLEGFIVPDGTTAILEESEKHNVGEFVTVQEQQDDGDNTKTLYFVTPTFPDAKSEGVEVEERRVLSRLPVLAIFHGVSHERGVPPSFTGTHAQRASHVPFSLRYSITRAGFLKQWPALPTFGVFLTTKVLPIPRVNDTDRYVVSSVEALPGFYGVVQYLGFRDQAALRTDELMARIGAIEERYSDADRRAAGRARVEQLVELARHPTHMCVPSSPTNGKASTDARPLQHPALRAEEQKFLHGPSHPHCELPTQRAHRRYLWATE